MRVHRQFGAEISGNTANGQQAATLPELLLDKFGPKPSPLDFGNVQMGLVTHKVLNLVNPSEMESVQVYVDKTPEKESDNECSPFVSPRTVLFRAFVRRHVCKGTCTSVLPLGVSPSVARTDLLWPREPAHNSRFPCTRSNLSESACAAGTVCRSSGHLRLEMYWLFAAS
jgi:hypothetical protein